MLDKDSSIIIIGSTLTREVQIMSLSKSLGFEETFIKKIGGLIANPKIVQWYDGSCVVLTGNIVKDHAGRFSDRSPIRTSWIVNVTYNPQNDVTTVETRNTLYFITGNHLADAVITDKFAISGEDLKPLITANLSDWEHIG